MQENQKPRVVAIVGPTASGKSDLAVLLAKKFNGEVISADSRQVYRGMDIGTGKITRHEMRGVPHYLLDVASPRTQFSVMRFKKLARTAIADIARRGKLPIICGGTGFYVDAALYDWNLPDIKPDLPLRRELESLDTIELFARLKHLDPQRAEKIDPRNKVRLIRALEVRIKSGQPAPEVDVTQRDTSPYQILKIGITRPPKILRVRIEARIQNWLRKGLLSEVRRLRADRVSRSRLDRIGLEYRLVNQHLEDLLSRSQLVEKMNNETWQYAKRQMTWFKRDKNIHWIKNPASAVQLVGKFIK